MAYEAGDKEEAAKHREVVEALRNGVCDVCTETNHKLSKTQQACKDWFDNMRRAMAKAHDGCAHPGCPERGPEAWCALTADHGANPKKRRFDTTKEVWVPVALSNYPWWAGNGGVKAMEEEAKQIDKWICAYCHRLETTSNSGRRCTDPKDMPAGKSAGTKEEVAQYNARKKAIVVYPKQRHVDARKRAIGRCEDCRRPVVAGNESGFDFNHIDPTTKEKGGLFGKGGGVAGLVTNHTNAAAIDAVVDGTAVRDLLDAEMAKCNLLCANCHHRHTHNYPKRAPVA